MAPPVRAIEEKEMSNILGKLRNRRNIWKEKREATQVLKENPQATQVVVAYIQQNKFPLEKLVAVDIQQTLDYGKKILKAVTAGRRLGLNYHSGHVTGKYCVSIVVEDQTALPVLGQKTRKLEELAHISGIASSKLEGEILMPILGEILKKYYNLSYRLKIDFERPPI